MKFKTSIQELLYHNKMFKFIPDCIDEIEIFVDKDFPVKRIKLITELKTTTEEKQ